MAHKTAEGRSACQRSRPSNVASAADIQNIAFRPAQANGLFAIFGADGVVVATVASRAAARAFMMEAQQ